MNIMPSADLIPVRGYGYVPQDRLFTKAEYARRIDKSHTWVNELVKAGDVVQVRVGNTYLVCHKDDIVIPKAKQ